MVYIYLCLSVYLFIRSDNFLIHYEIAFILFESIVQPVCFCEVILVPVVLFRRLYREVSVKSGKVEE